jgi:hypothetical protein
VKPDQKFEVHILETAEPVSWRPLAYSAVIHALVILVLILKPELPRPEPKDVRESSSAQPIALPPLAQFQPPEPRQQQSPVPEEPVPLGPDSPNPDGPPREQGEPTERPDDPPPPSEPEGTQGEREEEERAPERVPTPEDLLAGGSIISRPTSPTGTPTQSVLGAPMASSATARRTPGAMGAVGFGSGDTRGWREVFPESSGKCVEIPDLGRNPDGTPVLASVTGVVRDQSGRPLPGAHLVIVGAPYSTFSDAAGNYRLEFDPALLQKCRVQYVRVAAAGFRSQDLTLAIGRRVRSDDVFLRRR